ncbi:MAG: YkgJ family cysteine cluster protein [Deltaproteobacteria bacterium]|nr:YkgJ family cysteine cluster protein [Deltaproteobacteria bacterium]
MVYGLCSKKNLCSLCNRSANNKREKRVGKEDFQKGIALFGQPVLPLVSMVQFLYLTGSFTRVEEVIDEMPEPIETGYALYENPRALLRSHLEHLRMLEGLKSNEEIELDVVNESDEPVDDMTALASLVSQRIMEDELEVINSVLCGPCGCTLCCTGPSRTMNQEFFEIPLKAEEKDLFPVTRHDSVDSRRRRALDDEVLQVDGTPFYQLPDPGLFCWQNGWSLILPRESSCPGLEENGRCRVYLTRPQVCRRPQIFSYILEKTDQPDQYRLRSSLLAITDCPYVQVLQEEIAAYAAACELELVLKGNKQ